MASASNKTSSVKSVKIIETEEVPGGDWNETNYCDCPRRGQQKVK